jgi:hypothetical protein
MIPMEVKTKWKNFNPEKETYEIISKGKEKTQR